MKESEPPQFHRPPELPPHKSASRKPAVGLREKGGGDILYQGCESQFHALCFSYGGLAARLAERLAGCTRRNALWMDWPGDWDRGLLGYYVAPGVLI